MVFLIWIASILSLFAQSSALVPVDDLGLRIARSFRVTLYADSDLANDIYAMTLDSRGDVVVTSRGYIRTLLDSDNDGVADTAREFASTVSGGMGLCFDGTDLYFTGDGHWSRFTDANGDGVADGPPQQLTPLAFGEHGGHAPRKGPDGWWYVIGGNDARFNERHVTIGASPVQKPQAGALIRLWPDGGQCEVVAHGFRNPYDLDFNWMGDLFTYDSDVESDFFLPWYTPTRIYHIAHGAHHGWQLTGWKRSWNRPDYYLDTVRILASVGRGSPTGVTCYRHQQFPQYYRGGLFALDWTFGRIYFLPLEPDGATYSAAPEVFLEPIGNQGFAPTDIVVAPDGSLFVSIGGRKTRGGVFRIDHVAGSRSFSRTNWMNDSRNLPLAVLAAPQPLDAWSRAWWVPRALQAGAGAFNDAALNQRLAPGSRVRAIEILTELFNGLSVETARAAARADSAPVRARVAWSLGRLANRQFSPIISSLAVDADPLVRRCALEAILDRADDLTPERVLAAATANLADSEPRIRQLAANLAQRIPNPAWDAFWKQASQGPPQARLSAALALAWRGPLPNTAVIETAVGVLSPSAAADHRLQALRLIALGLGDWNLDNPSVEVYTAYENPPPVAISNDLIARTVAAVAPVIPSGDVNVDAEAGRILAILRAGSPKARQAVLSLITGQSSPTSDFHYLTVLSRMSPDRTAGADVTSKIANAILSLDRKLSGRQQRTKQNWTLRLTETVEQLAAKEPGLAATLLRHPQFARPAHVSLVKALGPERQPAGARLFAEAVRKDPTFEWSAPLLELLSALPVEEVRSLFRSQWANLALREDLVLKLAEAPDPADREKFLVGMASARTNVVHASVRALLQLPEDASGRVTLAALRLLRRLFLEPKESELRHDALALINHQSGNEFSVAERGTDPETLRRDYQPIFDWFAKKYPTLMPYVVGEDHDENPAHWASILRSVAWNDGSPMRGQEIYRQRGCQICHSGTSPLGPDLGGAAARFSPIDLFNAIIFPNRDVAPPYRSTVIETRSGQTHTGLVVFESADGVILQTGATTTVRLSTDEIASRKLSTLSLMPGGLLAGLHPLDLADLYQYLKSLPGK
ncbi:MAG: hypothetical protein L0Y58_06265 [Verrucomicrobia subdivision 3 bacterium]|nr:hypothetical protein [Limisphaerales bacterium]